MKPTTETYKVREIVDVRLVSGSAAITIPKNVRRAAGLTHGDRVMLEVDGPGRVVLTKEPTSKPAVVVGAGKEATRAE